MVDFDVVRVGDESLLMNTLLDMLRSSIKANKNILKLVFFTDSSSNGSFSVTKKLIIEKLTSAWKDSLLSIPCVSIVAQAPLDNSFCTIEVLYLHDPEKIYAINFYETNYLRYCLVKGSNDILLVTSSVPSYPLLDIVNAGAIYNQIFTAFQSIEEILLKEGFGFQDIIRQWTYIDNVLGEEEFDTGLKQFYQIFNDLRSLFFEKYHFNKGYMAATGIGSSAGIITTEIMAYRPIGDNAYNIAPVKNPRQINAYEYSSSKLMGTPLKGFSTVTTPKFERGKLLYRRNEKTLFLSGTSSVIGEDTMHKGSTLKQAATTVENIEEVFLNANHLATDSEPLTFDNITLVRVYLSFPDEYETVKLLLEKNFPAMKTIFLKASICRSDLNIEIEAVAQVSNRLYK
jgi:enamine deaminase RidA (YjgF/YER057c/UK114 family)